MNSPSKIKNQKSQFTSLWLDVIVLLAWGSLLLKYWLTGQLKLLIHPNYFWLVFVTSMILLILGSIRALQLLRGKKTDSIGHINVLPKGWASTLLIVTAIVGFLVSPGVLTSQTALKRGITDSLPEVRSQPDSFRLSIRPEERSLIDWVRTLNAYPEPEAYEGQKAKVSGFVVHLPQLPDNYLLISRFVITCCAVDAYPVGIPVKLETSRDNYKPDTWLEIEGETIVETIPTESSDNNETVYDKRRLVIAAQSLKKIPTPKDPYNYHS
ncbi:MAG: TIGR03943 family protein [Prochloraceae cyanobacterium]|nr:TIGR03943 family protein [Prochloraceae cyanobacterium]